MVRNPAYIVAGLGEIWPTFWGEKQRNTCYFYYYYFNGRRNSAVNFWMILLLMKKTNIYNNILKKISFTVIEISNQKIYYWMTKITSKLLILEWPHFNPVGQCWKQAVDRLTMLVQK